jgi:hypothetical protein
MIPSFFGPEILDSFFFGSCNFVIWFPSFILILDPYFHGSITITLW